MTHGTWLDDSNLSMCQMVMWSNKSLSGTHVGHMSQLKRMKIQRFGYEDKEKSKEPMRE